MSPSLERVTLCRRCPVGSTGATPSGHQSQALRGYPLCGLHVPSCSEWVIAAGALEDRVGPSDYWL